MRESYEKIFSSLSTQRVVSYTRKRITQVQRSKRSVLLERFYNAPRLRLLDAVAACKIKGRY